MKYKAKLSEYFNITVVLLYIGGMSILSTTDFILTCEGMMQAILHSQTPTSIHTVQKWNSACSRVFWFDIWLARDFFQINWDFNM